ncbi:hypothetical protein HY837_03115 [archaeon]|nr:hypothetical protein [archaeon]
MDQKKLEQYLQSLGQQKQVDEKDLQVTPNPTLDLLCRTFENWLKQGPSCSKAEVMIKELHYTAKDVTDFSVRIKQYEETPGFEINAGEFLSYMINLSPEQDFVVITQHLNKKISRLGTDNNKNITVVGSLGGETAIGMESGRIEVQGNSGRCTGDSMRGGILVIRGDVGSRLGAHSVNVNGAEIYVEGKKPFRINERTCGAKIYHQGTLIHEGHGFREDEDDC